MLISHWPVLLILFAGMAGSIWLQKLTPAGAITGGIIGFVIYAGAGYSGLLLMATFFILGTAATAWHGTEKKLQNVTDKNDSRRTAAQVIANAGMAGALALLALLQPQQAILCQVALAAVFASATADTVSSELGNVYGKHYYNIVTWKKDQKGLDGVISWEGTLAGLAGTLVIALLYTLTKSWIGGHFIIIVMAGNCGNFMDSILGATLERKGFLKNNAVNFINTFFAAAVAYLLYFIVLN